MHRRSHPKTVLHSAALLIAGGITLAAFAVPHAWADDGQFADLPPELAAKLAAVDADGDGLISRSEFPKGDVDFDRVDRDGDGQLTPREVLWAHSVKEVGGGLEKIEQRFAKTDVDADGLVSTEESTLPEDVFQRLDRDGDSHVSFPEALAYTVEEELAEVFAKHDGDLSGTLTHDEMPAEAAHLFALADVDGDGEATGAEAYDMLYGLRLEAHELRQGTASPGMSQAPKGAKPRIQSVLDGLLEADGDGDGFLAPGEFPGSATLFARCDVDGDGRVESAEVALRQRYAKRLIARGDERTDAATIEQHDREQGRDVDRDLEQHAALPFQAHQLLHDNQMSGARYREELGHPLDEAEPQSLERGQSVPTAGESSGTRVPREVRRVMVTRPRSRHR